MVTTCLPSNILVHDLYTGKEMKTFHGVATFVQGTVVQGHLCTRDISLRRLLSKKHRSKETSVQGSYYFFILKSTDIVIYPIEKKEKFNWESVSLVKSSCDKSLLRTKSPWTTVPWIFVPLDKGLL